MRRYALTLFAVLALWMVGDHAVLAQRPIDNCGPRYRRDPAATNRAREAKKAYLRSQGMPERFLHLLDREECVACVEMASDAFHIMVVYNDDEHAPRSNGGRWTQITFKWDPQSERQVRDQLAAGTIKAFYIMNTATRCQCCPDVNDDSKTNESYADWNPELGVHMSHVIAFDDKGDLGPLPPDLENPPDGWINDVPNIEQFTKPRKRQVHVVCPACQGLAGQWTSAADTLDSLWDRKLTLLKGISITENAMGHRANEISRLEYQQLFSTRTDARQQQIEALKKVNEQQQESIAYDQRRLDEVDRDIAETDARMAAIMKQILECEKRCQTAVGTSTPPANTQPVTEKPPGAPVSPPPATGVPPVVESGTFKADCPQCQRFVDALNREVAELGRVRAALQQAEFDRAVIAEELKAREADEAAARQSLNAGGGADAQKLLASAEARTGFSRRQLELAMSQVRDLNRREFSIEGIVKSLEFQLSECNQRCTSTSGAPTDTTTGDPPVTTGTSPETTGTPPPADPSVTAACPACENLASRIRQTLASLAKARERIRFLESQIRITEREIALEQQKGAVPADLTSTLQALRQELIGIGSGTSDQANQLRPMEAELARCNKACTTETTGTTPTTTGTTPTTTGTTSTTTGTTSTTGGGTTGGGVATDPVRAACPACDALANSIRDGRANLVKLQQQLDEIVAKYRAAEQQLSAAKQQAGAGPGQSMKIFDDLRADAAGVGSQMERQRQQLKQTEADLEACNQRCTTTGQGGDTGGDFCANNACVAEWRECHLDNSCEPIDRDCAVAGTCDYNGNPCALTGTCGYDPADPCGEPGACSAGASPRLFTPTFDLTNSAAWGDTIRIQINTLIQEKGTDVIDPTDGLIPPADQPKVGQWFNPLGLLARHVRDHVDRWRGSMGPRPLWRADDLKAIESVSSAAQLGLPRGVHVLLTDRGGSTGRTLSMQVLNLSGRAIQLPSRPFAVQAIAPQSQKQIQQAFSRLSQFAPKQLDLSAYCLEFLKAPPGANQILRLAPKDVQDRFAPMSKVLRSAYRIKKAGLLNPDSNLESYADSIKQWSLWAVEQKLNESRFTQAFLGHTKKNVEAAGQQWPKDGDAMVRKVAPNRWRDIAKILSGAGLPVPQ